MKHLLIAPFMSAPVYGENVLVVYDNATREVAVGSFAKGAAISTSVPPGKTGVVVDSATLPSDASRDKWRWNTSLGKVVVDASVPDSPVASARAQAIALAKKLKASPGTMTDSERDTLLLRLCFLLLSQDQ